MSRRRALFRRQIASASPGPVRLKWLSLQTNHSDSEALAFTLGKEEYGTDILKLQEIRG